MYPLLRLRRYALGVKSLVYYLELAVINLLAEHQLTAERRENAPGVYINEAKIAALGLRIRQGRSYHGLSFNLDMDLTPYQNIDPCGFKGLAVTQLKDCLTQHAGAPLLFEQQAEKLVGHFVNLI